MSLLLAVWTMELHRRLLPSGQLYSPPLAAVQPVPRPPTSSVSQHQHYEQVGHLTRDLPPLWSRHSRVLG